ncbi:hypothetical protein [Erwinia phage FBB1]|nr:hypothetical protein [Erwinia phage FBB1]
MGKTIRRKSIKHGDYYTFSRTRGEHSPEVADAIFHGDSVRNWSGLDSDVKSEQNKIARMEKRKIQNRVMSGKEPMYDKTDRTVRSKANKCFQYS